MATFQEKFNLAYERAHAANPRLTKAAFMFKVYGPDRWSSPKSAQRAFNKISSGENDNPESYVAEENKVGLVGQRVRPSKRLMGLWKVNVAFQSYDEQGEPVIEIRSFIAQSDMYTSVLDVPLLEQILQAEVAEHTDQWIGEYDEVNGEPVDYYTDKHGNTHAGVEVFPINQSQLHSEERVDIDSIVLEGY